MPSHVRCRGIHWWFAWHRNSSDEHVTPMPTPINQWNNHVYPPHSASHNLLTAITFSLCLTGQLIDSHPNRPLLVQLDTVQSNWLIWTFKLTSCWKHVNTKRCQARSSNYSLLRLSHLHSRDPRHRPTSGECIGLSWHNETLRWHDTCHRARCDRVDSQTRPSDRCSQSFHHSANVVGCTASCYIATRSADKSPELTDTHGQIDRQTYYSLPSAQT